MLQGEECDLWRLLYSKRKLSAQDKTEIQSVIDNISYTCGATLQELDLPDKFSCIHVRQHNCFDPIEKGIHFFHSIWTTEVVFYHVISWNE